MGSWVWAEVSILVVLIQLVRASTWWSDASTQKGVVVGDSPLTFSTCWKALGPFRLGTRESVWGADPIEYYGGIRNTTSNEDIHYHSPLAANATVQWENRTYRTDTSQEGAIVGLKLQYADIDWHFAQQIYGWSAIQFQAWVIGELLWLGSASQPALLYTDNILELWVGDDHIFGGDFYSFRRAPVVIHLHPGINVVRVRLLGDIRSMGGRLPPNLQARLEVKIVQDLLAVDKHGVLLPDVVRGHFCAPFGSVTVRNQGGKWVKIDRIATSHDFDKSVMSGGAIWLAPGQSRPVKIHLDFKAGSRESINFRLEYTPKDSTPSHLTFAGRTSHADVSAPHKVTFLHPSGAVSYAILRPPSVNQSFQASEDVPVLVNLHGAGVEADSVFVRDMFEEIPELPAWVLSPAGMSEWSGDDWHTWGFADTEAAINMIAQWTENNEWRGPGVCLDKVLVAGHSNGGQGTWYFSTHQPERTLAAAAASGYSSIENYVPFHLWQEADPLQSAILQTARGNYRHELLVDNLVGLPILQQHGSADDNVPVYHSRLMNALLAQVGHQANYSEIPGWGHWVDGSMTTRSMKDLYFNHLTCKTARKQVPSRFSFVVPNSHDMGSRHGVFVDQLLSPDRMGKIDVVITETERGVQWQLKTTNIRRLRFEWTHDLTNTADEVRFDDMLLPFDIEGQARPSSFVKRDTNIWAKEVLLKWKNLEQRSGRQRGVLESILRSAGPFQLVYSSEVALASATQASRNLYQYYGADSSILPWLEYPNAAEEDCNIIIFALGKTTLPKRIPRFPIVIEDDRLLLTACNGRIASIPFAPGLGGVWLRPLPNERLELVVWGFDSNGLKQAARLVPTLTGAGQPDFVIFDASARWKGHGGAVAMGFFDYRWRISAGSYLP
ncbi:uncharacterized protein A1O9_09114 [Exophiala aquamarina CBS 119918]|uniref:Peptidase S9 prolyl oligopeptidase catalytic domain-containing protein n=1 Tax=Exophiala aquamarina CBS 119918 TaxID=1182545 RepID=A0A072P4N1_9EURO|nr:uncharacterized protein A1O9_09114 [Exophiala aquamarina CBS 119918]KEF54672.1 hypothetical protein A1O9_09114 [Exophiala aquamarina CBS 119918]